MRVSKMKMDESVQFFDSAFFSAQKGNFLLYYKRVWVQAL